MRPRELKELVLERLTMREAMEEAGIAISSKREALCPFHSEDTASFHVYGDNGHCYGCGWNGDIVKFEMEFYNLSFIDAIKRLNSTFQLGLPIDRRCSAAEQMRLNERRKAFNKRQAERRAKEAKREKHLADYCEAVRNADKYAPISPDLPWADKWCDAMKNKDYYAYLVDCDTAEIYSEEKGCLCDT